MPNVDNPIIRIPIWQETQTFETHTIGDLTMEKTLTVYIAYKEDNGNIVPEVKFRVKMHTLKQYFFVSMV